MNALTADLLAIGAIGPGFVDWPQLRALFAAPPSALPPTQVPALNVLPPAERRRVGQVVRLAIATGLQTCEAAGVDAAQLTTVFASSGGDGDNCHRICDALAGDDRLISPIRFHNSVNNAASGYWGIATGGQAPSTTVSAFDGSFAAGLLEAVLQLHTDTSPQVLLIAYDMPYPFPLSEARPIADAMGIGLLLSRNSGADSLLQLALTLDDAESHVPVRHGLDALYRTIPCARALPLLAQIDRTLDSGVAAECTLEHLPGCHLGVRVAPHVY